jgi:PAS domain S-box-containing protein
MLEQLFQLVPDALVLVDGNGTIVEANAQADAMFGYPRGGLPGVAVEQLLPESARTRHVQHRSDYMDNPRVRPMGASGQALIGRRRDGATFPVEIALSPFGQGGELRFLASIRDISETQRAQQSLVRARYDRIVADFGQRALVAPDQDSLVAGVPGEIASTLELDEVVMLSLRAESGRTQVVARHGKGEPRQDWAAVGAVDFGEAFEGSRSFLIPPQPGEPSLPLARRLADSGFRSGLTVPLLERGRPMGVLVGLSHAERSFDHDALHFVQSIANLVSGLIQRRRAEEQLAHAQRLEAVGQLTGGVAHDFNNLLTVVSGNLQLLELEFPDSQSLRELVGSALRAVEHGAALTSKLLAFARRQRLAPRAIDPGELLRELGRVLQRTLGERVQLRIDSPDDLAPIYADAGQLESALLNLALNARDAMPRGGSLSIAGREVALAAEAVEYDVLPGRYVVFAVSDTGLGMAPETLDRAFEPFFTTKEAGKGNGLGLSMVYGFVRQSGGQIKARSRLGYGTTMELFLPVAATPTHEARPAGIAAATQTGSEHVLVVEDEPDVRTVAVAFLRSLGYRVDAVATAEEALGFLAGHPSVALVFTDIALGSGMTGLDLARVAGGQRAGLALLLTSGHDRPSTPSTDEGPEKLELLPKPYRREDLALAVRRALDGAARRREDRARQ